MGHRPMYCNNLDTDDCTKHESVVSEVVLENLVLSLILFIFSINPDRWSKIGPDQCHRLLKRALFKLVWGVVEA